MRADDALKYAAAILESRTDWSLDSIAGSMCEGAGGHEDELDALHAVVDDIKKLATQFGDARRYSDGRLVKSCREIEYGLTTAHVWHPEPALEKSESWRGNLLHDPGTPCPGIYEVTTYPETQQIHVRVVKTA